MPWADDAAARLAVISGSTAAAVKNALPAFGASRGRSVRAVTDEISWKQRMHALIASNPRAVIESCPQELFTAAGYPETITTTAKMIQSGAGT
jgi:hypothetical protein